jgi:hypothetical protein
LTSPRAVLKIVRVPSHKPPSAFTYNFIERGVTMSAQRSNDSQGDTGTHDVVYNLVSTIYHALQGAETEAMYIADAQATGDQELIQFFTDLKQENARRADRAKQLLARQLGQQGGRSQGASGGGSNA